MRLIYFLTAVLSAVTVATPVNERRAQSTEHQVSLRLFIWIMG